jgi:hypothetical protein
MILHDSVLVPYYVNFNDVALITVDNIINPIENQPMYEITIYTRVRELYLTIRMDQKRYDELWNKIKDEELRNETKAVSCSGMVKE